MGERAVMSHGEGHMGDGTMERASGKGGKGGRTKEGIQMNRVVTQPPSSVEASHFPRGTQESLHMTDRFLSACS